MAIDEDARAYAFDLATAAQRVGDADGDATVAAGTWKTEVDPGWTVVGRPNGGYLLALAARAGLAVAGQPDPLAASAHFLASPEPGPAELEVETLRAGRSVATVQVRLAQGGSLCLEALLSAGTLDPGAPVGWRAASGPPPLAPLEACVPGVADLPVPGGFHVALLDHIDIRVDPACAGWLAGRPAGKLETRGWVRFHDGREPDPLALLAFADGFPPTSFELGIPSWAPTLAMSVYVRDLPAPGWLRLFARGQQLQGGWFDEEVELWDTRDRLVAQSRQLAGARTPDPRSRR
ncbi:MAG TPA: thioesterase family protein [Actinomycetota bacterium]